ncbi:MAG: response regulator [candidate division Zixibacteria bacterium]|nr:response regulator [candidate division Zixibacteria bacterium]
MPEKFKHTVLLVDDEEGILKALRRLLKNLDADIITANNGIEALEVLKNNQISLIISDQRMPKMTGVELLHHSQDISPDSIRILLTGYADIEATIEAINSGAIRYYFNKPWDDEILLSRIKESLDLYKMTVENKRLNKLLFKRNEELKQFNKTLEQRVDEQTKEIKQQHEKLNQSFMETIKSFSTIIGLRFKEMGSHSQRVATLTKNLLEGSNLNQKEYQDVIIAAYLHDIGKISLSDRIMVKNLSKYTDADLEEIRKHPILGQSCVYNIYGFEEIGIIIRHHHENYNGSGYPDKIKGLKIPFGSRVIRIADAFDRLAFDKAYPNLDILNRAAAHLVKYSSSKYDPDLVKKFIELGLARRFPLKDISDAMLVNAQELKVGMVVASDITADSGMFLLPKGVKLSMGMVKRIQKIDKVDPISNGICVYRMIKNKGEKHEPVQDIIG